MHKWYESAEGEIDAHCDNVDDVLQQFNQETSATITQSDFETATETPTPLTALDQRECKVPVNSLLWKQRELLIRIIRRSMMERDQVDFMDDELQKKTISLRRLEQIIMELQQGLHERTEELRACCKNSESLQYEIYELREQLCFKNCVTENGSTQTSPRLDKSLTGMKIPPQPSRRIVGHAPETPRILTAFAEKMSAEFDRPLSMEHQGLKKRIFGPKASAKKKGTSNVEYYALSPGMVNNRKL